MQLCDADEKVVRDLTNDDLRTLEILRFIVTTERPPHILFRINAYIDEEGICFCGDGHEKDL